MNFGKSFFQRKVFYNNKYFIVTVLFIIFLALISQNNLIERISAIKSKNELIKQKEYYQNKIKENNEKIRELRSNKLLLEKFVREEYLMKKKDEVIFLVVDSNEKK
ncbi:MAG: hypothetical protein Fur0028_10680 [Bacteroidales bacterium]